MRSCAARFQRHFLRRVIRVFLLAAGVLLFAAGHLSAQTGDTYEGRLSVIWGDPRPGQLGGGDVIFELYRDDGTYLPLRIAPEQRNQAIGAFGKRVIVRGRSQTDQRGRLGIDVESVEVLEKENRSTVQPQAVTTRRMLSILVRFKRDNQQPHSARFFNALANPKKGNANLGIPATINGFYDKTSWGQFVWQGDVVGEGGLNPKAWLTLPKTKLQYANCGWSGSCAAANLGGLFEDAVALAVAEGVNLAA